MHLTRPFLITFAAIGLLGCGSTETQNHSSSKWAHTSSQSAMSIINSRIQYLQLKFKTDYSKVSVCVQGSESYGSDSLLLETKLAYAAWLDASGQGSRDAWDLLDFTLKPSCRMNDAAYSSVVVISEETNMTPDQEIDKTFKKSKVSCKRVGMSASCSTGSMTMGLGGPGGISYRYFKPEIWDSLSNRSPATVLLSPFVQWTSLEGELRSYAPNLVALYADLKARADDVSYEELLTLNKGIEAKKMFIRDDDRLGGLVQTFLDSKLASSSEPYSPTIPGYHVLLHEVGHQFGMDHADNPSSQSETGASVGATQSPSGQWETELSTMAYADEYLYLTPDDKAGIKNLASKNALVIKAHRGP